jgi:carbonic anhydrase/acetyltransferase-like protein (isoleucine patch superfamily)
VLVPYEGLEPDVSAESWVAPNATLVGRVTVEPEASVWFGAVIRGDGDRIEIGAGSNVQDGCVLHADPGFPLKIGSGVSIGHNAVVHGCVVEDDVLVGMGAVVMNGARVGQGSLVAAGTVVLEGTDIPPGSLVAGVPGKVRRSLTDDEMRGLQGTAARYRSRRQEYAAARRR